MEHEIPPAEPVVAEREVVKADPALRRRALIVWGIVLVAGAWAVVALPPKLHDLLVLAVRSPEEAGTRATRLLLVVIAPPCLFGVVTACQALRRSWQTLRSQQFPPPGTRVLRDTPVLRGRQARVAAHVGIVLALVLLGLCAALPVCVVRAGDVLRRGCPRRAHTAARAPQVDPATLAR